MAPDGKYKNHPADTSLKEELSIDTTIEPSYISWDTPFKGKKGLIKIAVRSNCNGMRYTSTFQKLRAIEAQLIKYNNKWGNICTDDKKKTALH